MAGILVYEHEVVAAFIADSSPDVWLPTLGPAWVSGLSPANLLIALSFLHVIRLVLLLFNMYEEDSIP